VKKVLKSIKKQFAKAKKHPKIAIPVVVIAVLLLGGLVTFAALSGGDGDGGVIGSNSDEEKVKPAIDEDDPEVKKARKRKVVPAPVISGAGTVDTARSIGRLAVAQGRGLIKNPSNIQVRVSAAPKQEVTVDWQLSCYKRSGTKIASGRYRTRPPDIRSLPLPLSDPVECTATVGAQLTSGGRKSRVKVAVISG